MPILIVGCLLLIYSKDGEYYNGLGVDSKIFSLLIYLPAMKGLGAFLKSEVDVNWKL